jgi:hypothetical protein
MASEDFWERSRALLCLDWIPAFAGNAEGRVWLNDGKPQAARCLPRSWEETFAIAGQA